jgi:sulfur carrier protein ThiS
MTVSLSLTVNDSLIHTDYFVEGFIDHTVSGMIEALKDTGKIKDLNLSIDGDKVIVNLNGAVIPTNAFASKIIKSTIIGMLSPLKGVTADVTKLSITIHK